MELEQQHEEELQRRQRRKDAYHLAAGRQRLAPDIEEEDALFRFLVEGSSSGSTTIGSPELIKCKANLIRELAVSRGDSETSNFTKALEELTKLYDPSKVDVRVRRQEHLGGMWLTLTKPKYKDCLGLNSEDEFMYTLSRMSFNRFQPGDLVCSIQGTFNPVHYVSRSDREAIQQVPPSLKEELKQASSVLRTYDIVTACTIEPQTTSETSKTSNKGVSRPIKALMTTYGYALPDPSNSHRLSIWFTGGSLEVNDAELDLPIWVKLFRKPPPPRQPPRQPEKHHHFGRHKHDKQQQQQQDSQQQQPSNNMERDGKMSYSLKELVGGHGVAYVDILYLDETLRIIKGSAGDTVVFARCPYFPDE